MSSEVYTRKYIRYSKMSKIVFESIRNRSTIVECKTCKAQQTEFCFGKGSSNTPAHRKRLSSMYRALRLKRMEISE
jgi:hypothetical protein